MPRIYQIMNHYPFWVHTNQLLSVLEINFDLILQGNRHWVKMGCSQSHDEFLNIIERVLHSFSRRVQPNLILNQKYSILVSWTSSNDIRLFLQEVQFISLTLQVWIIIPVILVRMNLMVSLRKIQISRGIIQRFWNNSNCWLRWKYSLFNIASELIFHSRSTGSYRCKIPGSWLKKSTTLQILVNFVIPWYMIGFGWKISHICSL